MAALPASRAEAQTALEQRIAAAPSPHRDTQGQGPTVVAHWAKYVEQLGDDEQNQLQMRALREAVDACARSHRETNQPVEPIKAWPTRPTSVRTDIYVAADRSVSYAHGASYAINAQTCSLIENESWTATVQSARGICKVDLMAHTARGACTEAAARPFGPTKRPTGLPTGMPPGGTPAQLIPASTGEKHQIAGRACDVATNPLDPDHGTRCYARGARLAGFGPRVAADGTSLVIESRSTHGFVFSADDVALDMAIQSSVLNPQHAPGIRIEEPHP